VTILQALDRYYERMAARSEAELPGYSREKISFAIVLSTDGTPVDKIDLRDFGGKKPQPRLLEVPAAVKRTVGIQPNIFWDKTAYVLGRTAGEGRRTAEEHAAFKATNLALLTDVRDAGLTALRSFLEGWTSDRFDSAPFTVEMLDTNVIFRLDGDDRWLHERVDARNRLAARTGGDGSKNVCLITGVPAPVRRLHPTIKGVEGAQSSGAALVSFNLDAFTSYGKEQGANAPTSEAAAFRYGAALNRMLDRDGPNRLPRPVGDTTVVFWADASGVGEDAASAAENLWAAWLNPQVDEHDPDKLDRDAGEVAKLRDKLTEIAAGRPLKTIDPRLEKGVRFHILGLAPNAARLSVRYWVEARFEVFAERLADHFSDLSIEPKPWRAAPPSVARLLVKTTALQEKFDNVPALLAGEVMRAVLTGGRYPRTLLTAAIIRLRAGDDPGTGWHAAVIRAVLVRDHRLKSENHHLKYDKEETPVSLDRDNPNEAYQLGRLFAILEAAQRMALGKKINATIRDRYFGAASATPASVFPLLLRGVQNHLGKLRKEGKGGWIEAEIEEITSHLPPQLQRALRLEAQGRFAIGYYHQRSFKYVGQPAEEIASEEEVHDDE
jgi:CRISPR-associated protein Csd1